MSKVSRAGCLPFALILGFFSLGVVPLMMWGLLGVLHGPSQLGDGSQPETYGFDLSNLTTDRATLQTSGNPRDFLQAYRSPMNIPGVEAASRNAERSRSWQKEVVSDDRVIGVTINGEYRAYPLFILNAHEIVSDELGGERIIVTYSPLLDAACVYKTGARFSVSGLLDNLNLLMYAGDPASLYAQFSGKAISGEVVSEQLARVPGVSIDRWKTWFAAHPQTTVILRDPDSLGRYKRISYERYFVNDSWILKPVGEIPNGAKDRVLGVRGDGDWEVFDLKTLSASAEENGIVVRNIDGRTLRLRFDPTDSRMETYHVIDADGLELLPSLRIAWSLLNP